jgi:hypothetical protein
LNNARAHSSTTNDHNCFANFQLTRCRHRTHCRKTTATQNGIYVCNGSGAWSRATDFDASGEYENYKKVYVTSGSVNAGSTWFLKSLDSFVLDTNNVNWDFYTLKVYELCKAQCH